jgi:hypothetical protein
MALQILLPIRSLVICPPHWLLPLKKSALLIMLKELMVKPMNRLLPL